MPSTRFPTIIQRKSLNSHTSSWGIKMNCTIDVPQRARLYWFAQVCLIFLLLYGCYAPMAFSADPKTVFPIFYSTDRTLDPNVPNLSYTSEQLAPDELMYGVKNIVLMNNGGANESAERLQGLGWWNLLDASDPNPPSRTTTLNESDFFSQVKTVADAGPADRPVVLYVHGCCSDFNKTTMDGARIASAMAAPVVVYAWAAIPPLTKYKDNEPAQANSAKRFNDFLSKLESQIGASRIVIVGYSMGNRFLQESLKVRYWNHGSNASFPKFRATCFMCADVPVYEFAAQNKSVAWCSNDTYISKNNTDGALTASNIVHGLYTRLGAPLLDFKKIRGAEHVMFYDTQPILPFKHDLPIDLLAQLIRSSDTDYQPENQPYSLKSAGPDVMKVGVRNPKKVHTTIKE